MAAINNALPRLSKARGMSRRKQGGFVRLAAFIARWGESRFRVRDLFKGSEPGLHYETYDPNTILARRNLLTYSEQFDNAAWLKTATGTGVTPVVTANYGADPLGGNTADRLQLDSGAAGNSTLVYSVFSPSALSATTVGTVHTFSVWMRSLSGASVTVTMFNNSNVSNVTVTTAWQRFEYSVASAAALREVRIGKRDTWSSSGTADLLVWGATLEQAPAATAYQAVTDWNTEFLAAVTRARVSLWQDAAASIPVTAVEQPIGCVMDTKSGSLAPISAQLISGQWSNGSTPFDTFSSDGVGGFSATKSTTGTQQFSPIGSFAITSGKSYEVELVVTATTFGSTGLTIQLATTTTSRSNSYTIANTGTHHFMLTATSTQATAQLRVLTGSSSTGSVTVTSVSLKELPGNHATQATAGFRPVLSARVNLLTKSEQFDDAAWTKTDTTVTANAIAAPDGTTTAELLTQGSGGSARVAQFVTVDSATNSVQKCSFKRGNTDWLLVRLSNSGTDYAQVWINVATGSVGTTSTSGLGVFVSAAIQDQGNGWYRVVLTGRTGTTSGGLVAMAVTGDNSTTRVSAGTYYAWGADLRTAADAALNIPAYQRVNTSTDYDSTGFPHRCKHDGTDDFFSVPLNMSGTDKVTVWVGGLLKTSDAVSQMLLEHTATSAATPGSFGVAAPSSAGSDNMQFRAGGSVVPVSKTLTGLAAPRNGVFMGEADIAGDTLNASFNGSVETATTSDQGTGNFANDTLYIGARAGTSLRSSVGWTSITVRGASTDAGRKARMTRYAQRLAKIT